MSEKATKSAVRSIFERVLKTGDASGARRAATTFTIPEKPVFVLPPGVYDEVAERSERWHELGREIDRCAERERKKIEDLRALAEREAKEGVSLEAEMGRLQDEIAAIEKVRARAQVRLDPALRAAWTAVLATRKKIAEARREYDKKVDAYRAVLTEIAQAVQEAWSIRTGHDLGQAEYHRRHIEEKFGLPLMSPEFARGEPEREPPRPPAGVVEYLPEPVVSYPNEGSRTPVRPVTHEDVQQMLEVPEPDVAVSEAESGALLERMRAPLESDAE